MRGRRSRRSLVRVDCEPAADPRKSEVHVRGARLHPAALASRGVRRLRRDRPPRCEEDSALRRGRLDARDERRRRERRLRRRAPARGRPGHHVHLGRLRKRNAAVRGGRNARARAPDLEALVVRGLEDVRRAPRARPRGGARPQGDRAPALQRLRPAQPPELVGRPAGHVHRGAPRRRAAGDPRRRPPDPHVHVRERHGRRLRPGAAQAQGARRGDQRRRDGDALDPGAGGEGAGAPGDPRPAAGEVHPVRGLPGQLPGRPPSRARHDEGEGGPGVRGEGRARAGSREDGRLAPRPARRRARRGPAARARSRREQRPVPDRAGCAAP